MKGLNVTVKYKGAAFHIQTQDVGPRGRHIESLIYKSGKLIASRKTFYTPFLGRPDLEEKIGQIMEDQHNASIKEIAGGKFDNYLSPEEKRAASEES